jgi:hypothetical protein
MAAAAGCLAAFGPAAASDNPALDAKVMALAQGWDHLNFELKDKDARIAAADRIVAQAEATQRQFPGRAEPLVWEAITLSTEAGDKGGLGGLQLVKEAKALLERAEHINPQALGDGSVYCTLGSLYAQVPGFPIGFGDAGKARAYLDKAVRANPAGVDANFFYGDFLMRQHDYAGAARMLQKAVGAPARPGREVGDRGRRAEAAAMLAEARRRAKA